MPLRAYTLLVDYANASRLAVRVLKRNANGLRQHGTMSLRLAVLVRRSLGLLLLFVFRAFLFGLLGILIVLQYGGVQGQNAGGERAGGRT